MHREVNAIAGRMSLRAPQREALEILDRVVEIAPPGKGADVARALAAIQSEFPRVQDFEREFPSLCFALATGVGKTRLMGAFISYLHVAHGKDNFFVLAPNLTIYNKLVADFSEGSPKYVFKGIAAFATQAPEIITGDNYEARAGTLFDELVRCKINIFNISKINTEVRGGASPRIKRLSEYLGESYFDYLAGLPDLVLLMDESHRYRASAGIRAINELKPILGLELTATPYTTEGSRTRPFRNVVLDYPLRRAMDDGFVKEPAVATRKNLQVGGMAPGELERMKLEDGIRLHERTKVELETYARERDVEIVKPFVLVIARDTTHAKELLDLIQRDDFFGGRYREKVIQVDSSGSGVEKDETIERLLKVERRDEPTEIVIHVNMLKEGWDVTNLYTIVPLRAANARVLIEQTIGRGLRLPYGKRTGVEAVDTLTIVAHDRFQEIVDEARKPDSIVQLKTIVWDPGELEERTFTVVAPTRVEAALGIGTERASESTRVESGGVPPVFESAPEREVARLTYAAIKRLEREPARVPNAAALTTPAVRQHLIAEVTAEYRAGQLELEGIEREVDIPSVVGQVTTIVEEGTISIPRITVTPKGEFRAWFEPFAPDFTGMNFPPVAEALHQQELRTGRTLTIGIGPGIAMETRLEDYVIAGLIDFDDVSYDANAEMLQELATRTVEHFRSYLTEDEIEPVLRVHRREIGRALHVQMQPHYRTDEVVYETRVNAGFTEIRGTAFNGTGSELDFRVEPADKTKIASAWFGGFRRCLQAAAKFQSDTERRLAVMLDRDAMRWFRPAREQFQITYRLAGEEHLYVPDFVAELADRIAMIETKARGEMDDPDVLAKQAAAVAWCGRASAYAIEKGSKGWVYALIPHDAVAENWTAGQLIERWAVRDPSL